MYNRDVLHFWKSQGLKHIKPAVGGEFPEGWDVRDFFVDTIKNDTVHEVGCGYGRLAGKFDPTQYVGYDINATAIDEARRQNPTYTFRQYEIGSELPPSTWVFFYTVLLHVPDEDAELFLHKVTQNSEKVIIGEILGRSWRRDGNPPVFNREENEYVDLMKLVGFSPTDSIKKPYTRYEDSVNVTFLVFQRDH